MTPRYVITRCIEEKGKEAAECKKVQDYYKSMCPQWVVLLINSNYIILNLQLIYII